MTGPTILAASTRYFLPGTTKVLIVPTIANLSAPTRLELNAGTDISEEIAAIAGFQITSETVATPDLGKRFVGQVTGRLTASDSSITCWADKAGVDIRSLVDLDQETNVVFMDGGDVEDHLMDVYKVTVASIGKPRDIEGAGRVEVKTTIRDYAENIAIPASA
jgi:hypothetical protein